MRNFVLELHEEILSTCAKSIHHISLIERALTCSHANLRRPFLDVVKKGLLRRNWLNSTWGSPLNLTNFFSDPKAAGPLLYSLFKSFRKKKKANCCRRLLKLRC